MSTVFGFAINWKTFLPESSTAIPAKRTLDKTRCQRRKQGS